MTYREKLGIEYPDCIDEACDGGCSSCPHEYGYCKKDDTLCAEEPLAKVKPNEEKCRKCWDQTIPGTEKKIVKLPPDKKELKAMRAVFKDGHVEEIFYCSGYDRRYPIEFATKSGMYVYSENTNEEFTMHHIYKPSLTTRITNYFYKIVSCLDYGRVRAQCVTCNDIDHIEFEEVEVSG